MMVLEWFVLNNVPKVRHFGRNEIETHYQERILSFQKTREPYAVLKSLQISVKGIRSVSTII